MIQEHCQSSAARSCCNTTRVVFLYQGTPVFLYQGYRAQQSTLLPQQCSLIQKHQCSLMQKHYSVVFLDIRALLEYSKARSCCLSNLGFRVQGLVHYKALGIAYVTLRSNMYTTMSMQKQNNGGKNNRKALGISFTLRSSMYATMCIRELLKVHILESTYLV